MFRPVRSLILLSATATMLAGPAFAAPPAMQSYVVVLKAGPGSVPAVAAAMAKEVGGKVGFVYEDALEGFSITAPAAAMKGLEHNPRVDFIEADRLWTIDAQEVPTGIARAFAAGNAAIDIDGVDERVDVDVAVIDTGIDWQHPDLTVVAGINCAQGGIFTATCNGNGDDNHYHGTHVAGTIGALDNGDGVVGMAPGARLHAVKVLDSSGSGYTSWIVAGINWVAARADTIEVANMSLGGAGYSQSQYTAIQGAVNKGVAFAVAAGNNDADADGYSPGGFDNVLSVSALADFDGAPGGGAAATCRTDVDDTLADFSNWGPEVDVAAPGVCIRSTYPLEQGGYGTISGTSMASPHAAGALALLASRSDPKTASDVLGLYQRVKQAGNLAWTDDSGDGIKEPLLDVSTFTPDFVGVPAPADAPPTAAFTATCSGATCTFNGSESTDDVWIASYGWTFGDGATGSGRTASHSYAASGSYLITLNVTDSAGQAAQSSESVTVTVPALTLTGSASSTSKTTWKATVKLSGPSGASTRGTWSYRSTSGGCTIASGASSCQFSLTKIPKSIGSVTYTDSNVATLKVTVAKP